MNTNTKKMNTRTFKLIIGGALLGTAIYFVPFFILKVAAFFILLALVAWLFKGRRHHEQRLAFVDHLRNMSDEEYEEWKSRKGHCGHYSRHTKSENHE